ncbi:MAG: glycosyltransferase [Treponema sp.]|nr:glycosyltransferase [Treponema sp.]
MKLLYIHDGPISRDENNTYYSYSYSNLDRRYSIFSQNISLLIRCKNVVGNNKATPIPKNIRVVIVPNFKVIKNYLKNKIRVKEILNKEIRETDFLVLKMHSSNAFLAYRYAKKYNKPYLVEYVSCAWDSYWNYSLLGKILAPIMELQTKIVAKNAPYNYYVTKEFLQKHYPCNGLQLGCSDVELNEFDERILYSRKSKLSSKIIIGTAASLDVKYKGQQYVIKAISELKKQGIELEYHLAGGHNPANTYLMDIAKKYGVESNIIYVGMLNSEQIFDFYDSLDLYIQPSKQEGLPRSVVEAMSRGCPVLGSNIAGLPELLEKEFLFKPGNVKQIVQKIRMILNMDLTKVSERNFNKAKEYDSSLLKKQRENFYRQILEDMKSK